MTADFQCLFAFVSVVLDPRDSIDDEDRLTCVKVIARGVTMRNRGRGTWRRFWAQSLTDVALCGAGPTAAVSVLATRCGTRVVCNVVTLRMSVQYQTRCLTHARDDCGMFAYACQLMYSGS